MVKRSKRCGEVRGGPCTRRHFRRWGFYEESFLGRSLVSDARLVIFPPGSTTIERRWLRLWSTLPLPGAALAALATVVLSGPLGVTVIPITTGLYTAGLTALMLQTRRTRPLIRTLRTSTDHSIAHRETTGEIGLQQSLLAHFCALERALDEGAISPTEFEAASWSAWTIIDAGTEHQQRTRHATP